MYLLHGTTPRYQSSQYLDDEYLPGRYLDPAPYFPPAFSGYHMRCALVVATSPFPSSDPVQLGFLSEQPTSQPRYHHPSRVACRGDPLS